MPLPKARSNKLASNSFFIFITRLFPSLANLLVMIWYSRHLSATDYGHYVNFWTQLLVISPVICFGIHVFLVTYSPSHITAMLRSLSRRQYLLYAAWALLGSGVFAWLQYPVFGAAAIIPFLFILFYALTFIAESLLIAFRAYRVLTISSLVYAVLFCGIHGYMLARGFSLPLLFAGLLAITVVRLGIYCFTAFSCFLSHTANTEPELLPVQKIRSLWLHLGVYDILQVLFSYIDKFIISLLLTAPVSAIYYNGSQNIPVLPLLLSAAGTAVLVQLASGSRQDETGSIIALMQRSGRVLSCIVFPVFFFLFFFGSPLLLLLFTDKYAAAIPIFAVAVLVVPVKAYSFTTVLQRLHKGAIINIGAVADLGVACALMYPLYQWLGLPGVALSFVISTYLQAAFYLVYSARLLQVSPLTLVPYGNWLIKFITFALVLIGIRYVGDLYFTGSIPLILGAAATVALVVVSLLWEFKQEREHGGI